MIAIVANVLNSDVFKSEGSKSSTNSLRLDFSSRERLLLTAFNSIAELGLEYLLLRGSGAYDHIKELLEKKFIVKRKQKDGRSYWLSLSEKFFQTFAVSNEYLSNIGSSNNKQQ